MRCTLCRFVSWTRESCWMADSLSYTKPASKELEYAAKTRAQRRAIFQTWGHQRAAWATAAGAVLFRSRFGALAGFLISSTRRRHDCRRGTHECVRHRRSTGPQAPQVTFDLRQQIRRTIAQHELVRLLQIFQ